MWHTQILEILSSSGVLLKKYMEKKNCFHEKPYNLEANKDFWFKVKKRQFWDQYRNCVKIRSFYFMKWQRNNSLKAYGRAMSKKKKTKVSEISLCLKIPCDCWKQLLTARLLRVACNDVNIGLSDRLMVSLMLPSYDLKNSTRS